MTSSYCANNLFVNPILTAVHKLKTSCAAITESDSRSFGNYYLEPFFALMLPIMKHRTFVMLVHFACVEVHWSPVHKKVLRNLKPGDQDGTAG